MSGYLKPLPRIDEWNRVHWDGAREGRLMIQACSDCDTLRYAGSKLCPHCHGTNSEWKQACGKGVVWSWCVFHRAYFKGFESELPYNVVLIELDEGLKVYSNVVNMTNESLRIGMRVRAVFETATEEVTLVKFEEDKL